MSGDPRTVVVTVSGGIAEVWHEPEGVNVEVIDFDCLDGIIDSDTIDEQVELLDRMHMLYSALAIQEPNDSTANQWARQIEQVRERVQPEALKLYDEEWNSDV